MKNKFKEIHVVSNTHWDREFRFPFQRTRMMLVKMIDYLLSLLEKNPDYASYTLDSHAILIEDYLEARPEARSRLEKLVKERRLFLGPWYTLPDIPNIGQESVVRNLLYGHKVSDSFGHTMKVGYTPCSWGQTGQLPQIYAGFGIDTILFYRGISPHECTSEFIWEGADGTRALAHRFALFARYNYYYFVFRKITYGLDVHEREWWWGEHGETPFKTANASSVYSTIELLEPDERYIKKKLKPALEGMLEIEGGHYFGPYFLAMHGHDISWPHPLEPKVIKDAQKILPESKVIHSNLEDYMDVLKKKLDLSNLPVLKGERRTNLKDGYSTYLLPGTLSARTLLKKENFQTETVLVHQAEPAAVFGFTLGEPYPEKYLDLAWRNLLCTHTHDANAGCAPDEIIEDVRFHLRQARGIGETLARDTLAAIARRVDTSKASLKAQFLLIFNTLCFSRSETMELLIDLPEKSGAQSLVVLDPEGKECEYQLLSLSPEALFVDNPWNVPQAYLTRRFRIRIYAKDIPSMGYKVFMIEAREKPDRKSGSLFPSEHAMENDFLRVCANPDGTIDVTDKNTGARYERLLSLEDGGEAGNAWRHVAPANDVLVVSSSEVRIQKIEDGPLSASMRIELSLRLPGDCPDAYRRSNDYVTLPMSHTITLSKYSRKVDVITRFDNTAKDHRLRLLFPTGIAKAKSSFADSHFDVVERSIELPNCDDWKEPVVGTYPYRSFVDVNDGKRGLAVLSEGLQEYEVKRDEAQSIAITLVRAVRIKLEVSEDRKQELPDIGPQCPGMHEFRLAIYPHEGGWSDAGCTKEALKIGVPLMAAQFGRNKKGNLPHIKGLLSCSNEKIEVSAVKKAERGSDLILRLYNPCEKAQKATICFDVPLKGCHEAGMDEEKIKEGKISNNALTVFIGKKKIKTYLLEF